MSFDPEKVEHKELEYVTPDGSYDGSFVSASDYDQLLAMYRDAVKYRDSVIYG